MASDLTNDLMMMMRTPSVCPTHNNNAILA